MIVSDFITAPGEIMRVPDEIIGLWRFREVDSPRLWAATFCFDGHYYDTLSHDTLEAAVKEVQSKLEILRNRK